MNMITVSAKTLDEAITKALIELQTTSDHLHYEVIRKESSGLLGIFGVKPCIIRARVMSEDEEHNLKKEVSEKEKVESDKKQEKKEFVKKQAKEDHHQRNNIKKEYEKDTAIQNAARKFLDQVFASMGIEVAVETSFDESERELKIMMNGDDMGILIGKRGQTLDSLQYLVSLVVNKERNKESEGYIRVKLDTENYRERRKETLEVLAKNISYKVKRTKRSVSLEPMNPYERRIIHAALQGDHQIVTRSEGEDPYRHVVISLKRDSYNGGRREKYQYRRDKELELEISKEIPEEMTE